MGSTGTITQIIHKKIKVGGGSKKGRQHIVHQRKYLKQFERTAKNKARSWKKHLAKYPNDLMAAENIKKLRG